MFKHLKSFAMAAGVFLLCAAFNAAEAASAAETGRSRSIFELYMAAAPVSHLLLLTFIAGMALSLEHTVNIKPVKLAPPDLVADLDALVDEQQFDEALELCHSSDTYYAKVAGGGLLVREAGYEEMLHEIETVAQAETFALNTKISYLSLIGNVAPLLGLLGTVTGMITSFQKIETMKNPTPGDLAHGIYEALVNTTMGLFIAIVYLSAFFYFKNKVSSLTLQMNLKAAELVKKIHLEQPAAAGR